MRNAMLAATLLLITTTGCGAFEAQSEFDGDVRIQTFWLQGDDAEGPFEAVAVQAFCTDIDWGERDCTDVDVTYTLRDADGVVVEEATETLTFVYDDEYSAEQLYGRSIECNASTCTFASTNEVELAIPVAGDQPSLQLDLKISRPGDVAVLELTETPPTF